MVIVALALAAGLWCPLYTQMSTDSESASTHTQARNIQVNGEVIPYEEAEVQLEKAWKEFFCKGGPPPAVYLDKGWQLTCEVYWHPYDGHSSGYSDDESRCGFPKREDKDPPSERIMGMEMGGGGGGAP